MCLLLDAIHTLFVKITSSTSKVLDAVIDIVIHPELHQSLLNVLLSCINSLGKSTNQVVGIKSHYNFLIHSLEQSGIVHMKGGADRM